MKKLCVSLLAILALAAQGIPENKLGFNVAAEAARADVKPGEPIVLRVTFRNTINSGNSPSDPTDRPQFYGICALKFLSGFFCLSNFLSMKGDQQWVSRFSQVSLHSVAAHELQKNDVLLKDVRIGFGSLPPQTEIFFQAALFNLRKKETANNKGSLFRATL